MSNIDDLENFKDLDAALLNANLQLDASIGEHPTKEAEKAEEAAKIAKAEKIIANLTSKSEPKIKPKAVPETQTVNVDQINSVPIPATAAAKSKNGGLDFSKLVEADVYNMNIPIPPIEHAIPEHLEVELLDTTYVPRWVHINQARVGTMKSLGYTFVEPEDLAKDLKVQIQPDENGRFTYIDVVLMKCLKDRYFGKLRSNYKKALAHTSQAGSKLRSEAMIENQFREVNAEAYQEAKDMNRLGVFSI